MIRVSIAVVGGGRADRLETTLVSVREAMLPPGWQLEVLCMLPAGSWALQRVAQALGARCVEVAPAAGAAAARNAALSEASGQWLLILEEGQELGRAMLLRASGQLHAHLGALLAHEHEQQAHQLLFHRLLQLDRSRLPHLWSARTALLRRSAVLECGGWDRQLGAAAQAGLLRRLLLSGWDVDEQQDCIVHEAPTLLRLSDYWQANVQQGYTWAGVSQQLAAAPSPVPAEGRASLARTLLLVAAAVCAAASPLCLWAAACALLLLLTLLGHALWQMHGLPGPVRWMPWVMHALVRDAAVVWGQWRYYSDQRLQFLRG